MEKKKKKKKQLDDWFSDWAIACKFFLRRRVPTPCLSHSLAESSDNRIYMRGIKHTESKQAHPDWKTHSFKASKFTDRRFWTT